MYSNEKAPNLFILGSPKAGTTALSKYLQVHPDVYMSHPKEPNFFNTDFSEDHRRFLSLEDYLITCFGDVKDEKIRGEATVWYLYSTEAVNGILKTYPNARFIVMLRNPVHLVHSLHSTLLRSFQEDVEDFESAWNLIPERKKGRKIPPHCRDRKLLYYDEIASQGYLSKRLLDKVDEKHIHFVLFEEFIRDTNREYQKILDFLEVTKIQPESFEKVNENYQVKNKTLGIVLNKLARSSNLYKLKRKLNLPKGKGIINSINNLNKEVVGRKELSGNFQRKLYDFFRNDIELLGNTINRDINWIIQDAK